jgi:Zn-dependent peptidase ImmA (M78 family)
LIFKATEDMEEKEIEDISTAISGAFLFPKVDAIRELGVRRTSISKDMELVAKEYGISMFLLVKRAQLIGIISDNIGRNFYNKASSSGWRKNEPRRADKEKATLFKQLVCRAVNEKEISTQKGAELLKVYYEEIVSDCYYNGAI